MAYAQETTADGQTLNSVNLDGSGGGTADGLHIKHNNVTVVKPYVHDFASGKGIEVAEGVTGTRIYRPTVRDCLVGIYLASAAYCDSAAVVENTTNIQLPTGIHLKGSNIYTDDAGPSFTTKPSDLPTLDSAHPLFSNWQLYCHVDQKSGDLINLADRTTDGTLTNANYAIDPTYGRVVDCDGTGDYVDFGTGFDVSGYSPGWSVGLVFKMGDLSGTQAIFGKYGASGARLFYVFASTASLQLRRNDDAAGGFLDCIASTTLVADTWYRMVGTMDEDNNELRLYFEADAVVEDTSGSGIKGTTATASVRLGSNSIDTNDANVQIKTAFLADAIMTAEQAADWIRDPTSALTKQVPPRTLDPDFDWHDDIVLYSHVSQSSGDLVNLADETLNGTLTNATYATDSEKGRVIDFDGTGDVVNYGNSINPASYSGWSSGATFKVDDLSATRVIQSQFDATGSIFFVFILSDGQFIARRATDTGGSWMQVQTAVGRVVTSTWYTFVITMDETDSAEEFNLYFEDDAVSTDTTGSGTKGTAGTADLTLGETANGNWDLNGQIKTFFLTSSVLTADQVAAWIANPELPLRGASDVPALNPNLAWTSNVKLAVGGTEPRSFVPNVADRSQDGTLVNQARYIRDPDWGYVLDFDGTNDHVSFGTGFNVAGYSGWSVGVAFKIDSLSAERILISKADVGGYLFGMSVLANGSLSCTRWTTTGSNFLNLATAASRISAGTWYRAVLTMDETASSEELNLYLETDATITDNTSSGTKEEDGTADFRLGERGDGARDCDGQIAVAFLADTELTEAQADAWIADPHSLFAHTPSSSDAHKPQVNMGLPWADDLVMVAGVEGPYDTTVRNMVDGSQNGTITGATYAQDATYGEVLSFDGTADYVDFGTGFDVTGYSGWSIGIHLQMDALSGVQYLFGAFDQANNSQWVLLTSGTGLFFRRSDDFGGAFSQTASKTLSTGTWYTIVCTYNESTNDATMYVDQDAALTNTGTSGTKGTTVRALRLGRSADDFGDMSGKVAIAWMASSALTAAQAQAWTADPHSLFVDGPKREGVYTVAAGHSLAASVTRCWPLTEGAGLHAEDIEGNSNGTLDTTAEWTELDGEIAVNVTDSGTNADIDGGTSPFAASTAGSLVIRFFAESYAAGDRLLDDGKLQLYSTDTTGDLTFTFDGGTTTVSTSSDPGTNQWHTLVLAWDSSGTTDGWLDGAQVYTAANPGTPAAPTTNLFIGNDAGANNLDGYIAFVMTLNTEVSDAQGKSLSINPYQLLYGHGQAARSAGTTFNPGVNLNTVLSALNGRPVEGGPLIDAGVAVSGISDTTQHIGAFDVLAASTKQTHVAVLMPRRYVNVKDHNGILRDEVFDELAWKRR